MYGKERSEKSRRRKEEDNDTASATIRKAERIREEARKAAEAEALAGDAGDDEELDFNDDDMSSQLALTTIAPASYTDEMSQFNIDVADAMQALRTAAELEITIDNALHACTLVKKLCHSRYYAKSRLGSSGAADLLVSLYKKWRDHGQVMVVLNHCISSFVINETENKIFLGCKGICEDMVYVIKSHSMNYAVLQSTLQVSTDICNSKVQGMIKKHQQKSTQPIVSRLSDSSMYGQDLTLDIHYSCDNRSNLFQAGIVPLVTTLLKDFAYNYHTKSLQEKAHTDNIAFHDLVATMCQLVSTLAGDDDISKALGEANACEYISTLLLYVAKDKEFRQPLIMALLWSIVLLTSAPKAGNKVHFSECSVCLPILDLLYDAADHKTAYQNHNIKEFNHLVEYLAWALLNLSLACPENAEAIAKIKFAKNTLTSLIEDETIPASNRKKLEQVFHNAFLQQRPKSRSHDHHHDTDHPHTSEGEQKEGFINPAEDNQHEAESKDGEHVVASEDKLSPVHK